MRELVKYGKAIEDVVEVLEEGYDAPRKRAKNKTGRWLEKQGKVYNAVIAKDYNEIMQQDCWVLLHFGRFSK